MGQPVTIVDEDNKIYSTDKALFVTLPLDLFTDGGDGQTIGVLKARWEERSNA